MPRTGGIYSLPPGYEAVSGEIIQPSQHNPPLEDLAQAMTESLPRDGTAGMTGNLPMGGNRITGIAAATAPGHVPRYDQVVPASGGTVSGSLTVTGGFTAMGTTRIGTDGLVRVVRNTGNGTNYLQSGEIAEGNSFSPLRFGPYSSATYYLEISDSAITANGVPFTGSGAGLTNIPSASLTGTIPDARLPSNIVRTTGAQTISGNKTFSGATSVTGNFNVDASSSTFLFDADSGGRNAFAFRRNSNTTVVARIESNDNLSFNTIGGAQVQVDGDTIVTQGRTLTAGTGLSGLGNLSQDRTVNLALGSLPASTDSMSAPRAIVVDGTNSGTQARMEPGSFRSNFGIPSATNTVTAGTALTGGGSIGGNITLNADIATVNEAQAGSVNNKVMTPLRVAQATMGVLQSWSAPSRSTNTIYQNTTGRPIMVNVEAYNCVYQVSTTGSGGWVNVGRSHTNTDGQQGQSFIVPNGHYYRANLQGGSEAIHNWAELR